MKMNQKLNKPEKENQSNQSKERSKDHSKLKLLSFKFLEYLLLFFAGIYIVIIFPFIVIIDYFSDFKDYIIEDFQKSLDIIVNQPTLSDEEMVEFGNACVKIVKSLEIKNGD